MTYASWEIERIEETPQGLRVDFIRFPVGPGLEQRVSGFFTKWAEPPHHGAPFTMPRQALDSRKPRKP